MTNRRLTPFFSVIIPTYNRKDFFNRCIDSVLGQTFTNFELIVVDDGSTDGTIVHMADYTNKSVNYIVKRHGGVSSARNLGISLSRGQYLAFLDSDDIWNENKLEITSEYIESFPDIKIFHTNEIWHKDGKILNQKKKHKRPSGYIYDKCLPLCCIGMSTAVIKKDLFDSVSKFDENLPACEDYDLWLRACCKYDVKLIPEPLTIKNGGRADQLSNQPGLDKYRIYALEKIIKSGNLDKKQRELTYNELVKKCEIYANGARKRGKINEANETMKKIYNYID